MEIEELGMRALDRVVAILEAVAANQGDARPAWAASMVGLSPSTVARLMRQMADVGVLDRTDSGGYVLGARLLAMARAAAEKNPLIGVALPEMEALRDLTGETLSLHLQTDDRRICIAEVQSRAAVRRVVPLGLSVPLHMGATGQVILANTAGEFRAAYIAQLHLAADQAEAIGRRLNEINRAGYASAVGAWQEGVSGLAAAVFNNGLVVGFLSVSGPSERWTEDTMAHHSSAVMAAAARISTGSAGWV